MNFDKGVITEEQEKSIREYLGDVAQKDFYLIFADMVDKPTQRQCDHPGIARALDLGIPTVPIILASFLTPDLFPLTAQKDFISFVNRPGAGFLQLAFIKEPIVEKYNELVN